MSARTPLSFLAVALLTLTACSPAPVSIDRDLDRAPAWVTGTEDQGTMIWALGTATGIDDPRLLRKAALLDAREKIAARMSDQLSPTLTGLDADVREDLRRAVVSINLHGPHTERYWVGPSGTCYVRYEIPLDVYAVNVRSLERIDDHLRGAVIACARGEAAPLAR